MNKKNNDAYNTALEYIKERIPAFLTKATVYLILIVTIIVSCVQIYDRCVFHEKIKKTALEEVKRNSSNMVLDSLNCANHSTEVELANDSIVNRIHDCVIIHSSNHCCNSNKESLLDIMSKSDSLMSENILISCVILIVALLAALLLNRLEAVGKYVAYKNMKNEMEHHYIHRKKFDNLLARIESAYNVTIFIGTMSMMLPTTDDASDSISKNIGYLCSRLSLICDDINNRLSKRESRLDFLTKDEKEIVNMYLEDALGELKRSEKHAKAIENQDLCHIIGYYLKTYEKIKDQIDKIDVQ
jgi:hypothetical protein